MGINEQDVLDAVAFIGETYIDLLYDLGEFKVHQVNVSEDGPIMYVNKNQSSYHMSLAHIKRTHDLNERMREQLKNQDMLKGMLSRFNQIDTEIREMSQAMHRIRFDAPYADQPVAFMISNDQYSLSNLLYVNKSAIEQTRKDRRAVVLTLGEENVRVEIEFVQCLGSLLQRTGIDDLIENDAVVPLEERLDLYVKMLDEMSEYLGQSEIYKLTRSNLNILTSYNSQYQKLTNIATEPSDDHGNDNG